MTMYDSRLKSKLQPGATPADPLFLHEHVNRYWQGRVAQEWSGRHPMKGRKPWPGSVQMRSNDYLAISGDRRIVDAEIRALDQAGHGEAVSRVWLHEEEDVTRRFELRLAKLMQAEDAVLASSGYTANLGLIQAIANKDSTIYIDRKAHMSLWEGVKSSGATPRLFRHNDPGHLASLIRQHGAGIVIVDAVYSTDGAVCPIIDMIEAAEAGGCAIVVDETHSFGAQGPGGAGLAVAHGVADRVHFRTIGMSKAVAARGGAVICSRRNAEFFRYEAFPAIFSTSVLQHEVAGYDAVLDIFETDGWRRERLHANHLYLKVALDTLGYNVDASKSQIIALEAGEFDHTIRLRDALEERGVFGSFFLAPAVPASRCLIRFTLNAALTREQLDHVIRVCADVWDDVEASKWRSTRRRGRGSDLGTREEVPAGMGSERGGMITGDDTGEAGQAQIRWS
jgi:CAI-1 autoinducer synthase